MLESVMAVRKSGVLLFFVETGNSIRFLTDKSEVLEYDPILAGGFLSALTHFTHWIGEPLQAVILDNRILWLKDYESFLLVLSISRKRTKNSEWTIEQFATRLADSLCESIDRISNTLPGDFIRDEVGFGELLGEIIKQEGELFDQRYMT